MVHLDQGMFMSSLSFFCGLCSILFFVYVLVFREAWFALPSEDSGGGAS